ncbi:hypothetical protein B0J11DRAFT_151359 [Dendryphion nanum]|uniref:Uncharacterized protein n=1 Tax=Dendryphion nanum TaxID=256645 RepID=A0A9P9IWQ1_9PLEO|nr:hypothetical protein B0J11DRAFT_151359 [Dendryphion nanum]
MCMYALCVYCVYTVQFLACTICCKLHLKLKKDLSPVFSCTVTVYTQKFQAPVPTHKPPLLPLPPNLILHSTHPIQSSHPLPQLAGRSPHQRISVHSSSYGSPHHAPRSRNMHAAHRSPSLITARLHTRTLQPPDNYMPLIVRALLYAHSDSSLYL